MTRYYPDLLQGAQEIAKALDDACKKFKYWFEVSQERAQQWFTTHTRWFTVAFAVIFAFGLQLDTIEIFKFVSSNKAARDKLVAEVPGQDDHARWKARLTASRVRGGPGDRGPSDP